MGKHKLEPGEHGEIFLQQTGLKTWRGRTRLCLWDGTETWVSRNASTDDAARLKVQKGVVERLSAARGSDDLKPNSKVGLACRQWVAEMRVRSEWPRPPIRPQTVDEYERLLGNHVVPTLGKRRLNELTPALCQAFVDGIVKLGKSKERQAKGQEMVTTTLQVRSALCMVLDRAVVHDAIRDNPMRKTIAPARKKPNPKAMTVTDVYRLRTAVRAWEKDREGKPGPKPTGQLPAAIDVMLGTGMRIGEVMALRWGEVNLSPDGLPTIAVEATLTDVKGQGTVRQPMPKTDAGERVIIIPPFVVESLEQIRPVVTSAEMPVFPSRRFKDKRVREQTTANLRRTLRSALALAKMAGEVHPHLLRSTAATFVARRMRAADAAALLGHKIDAGVTGRHYIERLRLAPDTSAVLQEMVDIGKEEAAKLKRAKVAAASGMGSREKAVATRADAVLR
ncbi:Phage integrase, N-terminal SAM-like domain [Promicromonospora umidemergens]|uniref:Tyrosine-type recombinase/integrase n=1 Tax=Promicromonospora umidemergens TaxID=629679 RepID=A0ABP8WHT0_9MICO|nr:site-specific integrase [Promicromonospora umidemergens]MCP2286567.1 Phage integrase, N-terminal SAM-like domain [Promicromonospora umidemergens]